MCSNLRDTKDRIFDGDLQKKVDNIQKALYMLLRNYHRDEKFIHDTIFNTKKGFWTHEDLKKKIIKDI